MPRRASVLAMLCLTTVSVAGQDLENLQIHGFATQGLLYSTNNNYLTMKSSSGSLQWTEGAVSFSDAVTDKLRIGVQLHMYQMGEFGGPNIVVDWASGDYKVNDYLGFRVGKIKTPLGLYTDSQDVDALFLWIMLPQSMYPNDNRDYDLSERGGEVYGGVRVGKRIGTIRYRGHVGSSVLDANGGYVQQLAQIGLTFPSPPSGKVYGGDVNWVTPWRGLTVGTSVLADTLEATGPQGSMHMPASLTSAYYTQWDLAKLHLAAEYWRTPIHLQVMFGHPGHRFRPMETRSPSSASTPPRPNPAFTSHQWAAINCCNSRAMETIVARSGRRTAAGSRLPAPPTGTIPSSSSPQTVAGKKSAKPRRCFPSFRQPSG
jgi:hypothetical protein